VIVLAGRVEPTLGGPLLALFGDDARGMRAMAERDGQHLLRRRHFQVERDRQFGRKPGDVVVRDVPTVLAQMGGDPVGARLRRDQRRAHRIGIATAARVPDGRDMIDVDAEAEVRGALMMRGCRA
jgi:hypothetical protein